MPDSEVRNPDADLLFDAVREAGALAMTLFRQSVRRWSKSDGSQVTEADIKVNALLAGRLQKARPNYGWLSEETPDSEARLACNKLWIVDPIDGTGEFIRGGGNWCIAAALVENGRPVIGAVYRPVGEEFFSAVRGQGAAMNAKRLSVSDAEGLAQARIVGNRKSLALIQSQGISADVSGDLPLQLRLAFIAAARLDGALSVGNRNDWDLAAGDLIVHEAGGMVSDVTGTPYIYNRPQPWQQGLVAAGAKRHASLINALRSP